MPERRPRPPVARARPLAELALEPLLEGARELARRWAIALIGDGPAESLGAVPLGDLAREAPSLLVAVLGALRSEQELGRLLGAEGSGETPASRIAAMTGARDARAVVAAVESLRGVLADALMEQFAGGGSEEAGARQLTDLADRLAHVCAAMIPAALEGLGDLGGGPAVLASAAGSPVARSASRPLRAGVAIVDERARVEPPPAPAGLREEASAVGEPSPEAEIQIRDERGDEGPAAWIRAIGSQLDRFEADGVGFAVLLVELRGEGPQRGELMIEARLSHWLPPQATMTRERAGRYWVVVPGTDRLAAGPLAAELTGSLEQALLDGRSALEAALLRGRPGMSVAVGTAVCPEDGRRAAALAAHADVGLYAARAERSVAAGAEERPVN